MKNSIVLLSLLAGLFVAGSAEAQIYYGVGPAAFGPRHFGGYHPGGIYVSPFASPPASVRIRTPFFSLDTGPGYSSYRVGSVHTYGYVSPYGYTQERYEAYRPAYPAPYRSYVPADVYGYDAYAYPEIAGPAIEPPPVGYSSSARSLARPLPGPSVYPDLYQPGLDGGIPEISRGSDATLSQLEVSEPANLRLLALAADVLQQNLSRRPDDADIWMDYLAPDKIVAAIDAAQFDSTFPTLLTHYDGAAGNPQLSWLLSTPGFNATRRGLRQWVSQSATAGPTPTQPTPTQPTPTQPTPTQPTPAQSRPEQSRPAEASEVEPDDATSTGQPAEATETLPTPIPEVQPVQ